jgi:tellurite resistance-related uncharacterized protein
MKELPKGLAPTGRTPEFTEATIPAALLRAHTTKAGSWARIRVLEGALHYRIRGPAQEDHLLHPGEDGIIEPEVPHEVEASGPVRFYVEFLRVP